MVPRVGSYPIKRTPISGIEGQHLPFRGECVSDRRDRRAGRGAEHQFRRFIERDPCESGEVKGTARLNRPAISALAAMPDDFQRRFVFYGLLDDLQHIRRIAWREEVGGHAGASPLRGEGGARQRAG
jgi:hypothetical protein